MNKKSHIRDIVVIGASRGGQAALARIISSLPPNFSAAVLLAMHGSLESSRLFDVLLAQHAPLAVAYAEEGKPIKPRHIYLAPSGKHLIVRSGAKLGLEDNVKVQRIGAADILFRSAADVFGDRVIGVILTGDGRDGTDGMNAITATGGIRIVQSPADAVDPGMPSSAISGDHPQFIVMLDQIPKVLIKLVRSSN